MLSPSSCWHSHAHHAAAAVASIDADTRSAAGAPVVVPHRYSDAVHMLDEAAALAHTILSSAAPASTVESYVRTLQQARETLDAACLTEAHSALASASLPRIDEVSERRLLALRSVTLPKPFEQLDMSSLDRGAAVAALSPVPRPPSSPSHDDAAAGDMLAWAQWARGSSAENAAFAVAAAVQRWFEAKVPLHGTPDALPKAALTAVFALAADHRAHLAKLQQRAPPERGGLACELQSMQALVAWIVLCLAHRSALVEWPQLSDFSLPVFADDLRSLVLRDAADQRTLLRVAEYVSAYTGGDEPAMFSTAALEGSWSLADEYVCSSAALQGLLLQEAAVAEQRDAAHWAAVEAKLATLRELGAQLAAALVMKAAALADEQRAYAPLAAMLAQAHEDLAAAQTSLAQAATRRLQELHAEMRSNWVASHRGRRRGRGRGSTQLRLPTELWSHLLVALPEHAIHSAAEQAVSLLQQAADVTGKDSTDIEGGGDTSAGCEWHAKRTAFVQCYNEVVALHAQIAETKKPPADVFHSLPHTAESAQEARVAVFFMHLQHAGCLPLLAQACCDAAQVLLAPQSCHASCQPDSWSDGHNARHKSCQYVPSPPHLCTSAPEAAEPQWLRLATTQSQPFQAPGRKSSVELYERGDGVWYPGLEQRLLWCGGTVLQTTGTTRGGPPALEPFPERAVEVQAAALRHYTERCELEQRWLSVPTVAPSCLAAASRGAGLPALQDATDGEHRTRGNAPLAQQAPQAFSQAQWLKLATLRAFPLNAASSAVRTAARW